MRPFTQVLPWLAFLSCLTLAQGAVEYYGKFIGPLKTFYHGVTGDVYAVDARTLHIRDFNYDGDGPAAYFYVGTTKVVNGNGYKMLDDKGSPNPLKRYRRKHITLTLPEGRTLSNIKWFSVYCDEAAVNFADVKIPKGVDFPKPQKIAHLSGVHGVTSEPIVVVDAQTLLIPSFSYDGEAPDAKFWVGQGLKPSPQGIRVPDENGKEVPLRRYDRKTIVLTLPGDLTVFDIGHFGIWCEAFTVDFGHVQIPQGLNVPPSLKMLGVSPQKRSRSLQLSALPQQQLRQGSNGKQQQQNNRGKNNNFNYQNVLPLFNVQETIRPTTYRPQLLVQPTTVELGALENVDHRFSQKQTNGYLPLNRFGQQNQQQNYFQQQPIIPVHNRFPPTPSVQIIPSISLNEDNGLIVQNRFDLGPPLPQQFPIDPNFYNQQFQYDQFRNAQSQPQFLINVQDDQQVPFQRPIRKESNDPPPKNVVLAKEVNHQLAKEEKRRPPTQNNFKQKNQQTTKAPVQTESTVETIPSAGVTPVTFQIPIVPQGVEVSVSPAVLAEEFEQAAFRGEPQARQASLPVPADVLTVPAQFWNNGFFYTDFGAIPTKATVPVILSTPKVPTKKPFGEVIPRPVSRLRALDPVPAFKNNPTGSFSRFVIKNRSGVSDYVVRY